MTPGQAANQALPSRFMYVPVAEAGGAEGGGDGAGAGEQQQGQQQQP